MIYCQIIRKYKYITPKKLPSLSCFISFKKKYYKMLFSNVYIEMGSNLSYSMSSYFFNLGLFKYYINCQDITFIEN